ncbi:MAG: phosphoglucosamine mutase [Methylococcales bacterium]
MKKKFFGTDGIRGKVGEYPITPDFVLKLGWSAGRVFASKIGTNIAIGKDTRISGYMFESALEAGLSAAGANTQLLGPMPTPAIAYLTRTFRAQAGIVISASHNPYYDNGIKFFSSAGLKLPDEIELAIERELEREMITVSSSELGKATRLSDAAGRYIEFCKSTIPTTMDFSGLKVVVDCAHGSTYHIAPFVFDEIGADIVRIGCEPNGLNINENCGATNPALLQQKVLSESADLGIALDGDGDRVIMVDHKGEIVDGDEILYIIAKSRLQAGKLEGPVIGTLMSNLGLEQALAELGIEMKRAPVGDRYVMDLMETCNAMLGGESSGHIICKDRHTTGDGIIAALQVLAELRCSNQCLHELKQGIMKYPQSLVNVKVREGANPAQFECIQKAKTNIENLLGENGRVLLRPSGTEPLIRVMVEGRDIRIVEELANQLAEIVSEALQL